MRKSYPDLQKSKRSLSTHQPISTVSIFVGEFLDQKEDFPQECKGGGKTISRSIFCESAKISALVGREKIAFEY